MGRSAALVRRHPLRVALVLAFTVLALAGVRVAVSAAGFPDVSPVALGVQWAGSYLLATVLVALHAALSSADRAPRG